MFNVLAYTGGPPVIVRINNIPHSVQLLGPLPEVLVHSNPSHELAPHVAMLRSTKPMRRGLPTVPLSHPPPLKRARSEDDGTRIISVIRAEVLIVDSQSLFR